MADKTRTHHALTENSFVQQEQSRFAARLAQWREEKSLTRRELSESVGVSIQQIAAIEKGRTRASFELLVLLRKTMGLPSLSA